MKRTTVVLPDDLAQAVEREAYRRRVSASAIVREAVARMLQPAAAPLPWRALVQDGCRPAREMDRELAGDWAEAIARDRR